MNYNKHYRLLIEKARNRILKDTTYIEIHHIVPKSEGGNDDIGNLAKLTAREHFIAHWLLYRMDPTKDSRAFSFWRMCNGRGKVSIDNWIIIPSRAYEEARAAHSIAISKSLKGRKKSTEHLEKIAAANRGKKRSAEAKSKMSLAKKGKPLTQEHKDHMKGRTPWNKNKKAKPSTAAAIGAALKGNNNAGKACSIEGRIYPSAKEAAEREGIPATTLKNRLRNPKRVEYFYIE